MFVLKPCSIQKIYHIAFSSYHSSILLKYLLCCLDPGRFTKGDVSPTRGSEGIWQSNINVPIAIGVFILDSAADGLAS